MKTIIELKDSCCNNIQYKFGILVSNKYFQDKDINIFMDMSLEALLGFGKKMIRIASDYKIKNHAEFHTDSIERCASQPLGFYLDRGSPDFIVMVNDSYDEIVQNNNYNQLCNIGEKPFKFCVYPEEEDGWIIEEHEIGRYNSGKIKIRDNNDNDISKEVGDVILKLGKKGMHEFGRHILILANNFCRNRIYGVPCNEKISDVDYDFGVFSCQSKLFIRCIDGIQMKYDDIY